MKWIFTLALLAAAGFATLMVFYHPPMRLMTPPLLFQTVSADEDLLVEALNLDQGIDLFFATNRLPVGPRSERVYSVAPSNRLHLGRMSLVIGEHGNALDQIFEWTTDGGNTDRPYILLDRTKEIAALDRDDRANVNSEVEDWLANINLALNESHADDILIYVHGANTTVQRAAGQATQLRHYSGRNATVVLFAWPTAENFLLYPRDILSAFASAEKLVQLIELLVDHTDAKEIDVFTYSAGATVGSEALAQLQQHRIDLLPKIGEVYHSAPDADFRAFVDDMKSYAKDVRRVTVSANLGDSALRLSQFMNRASRAGRPDLGELNAESSEWLLQATKDYGLELIHIQPENLPELSSTSHTFWYDDPWISNDLIMTLMLNMPVSDRALEIGTSKSGNRYWTFPQDYPERMQSLKSKFRSKFTKSSGGPN